MTDPDSPDHGQRREASRAMAAHAIGYEPDIRRTARKVATWSARKASRLRASAVVREGPKAEKSNRAQKLCRVPCGVRFISVCPSAAKNPRSKLYSYPWYASPRYWSWSHH